MAIIKPCPRCQAPLEIPQPMPKQIHCAKCGGVFENRAAPKAEAVQPASVPVAQASTPSPLVASASPPSEVSRRSLVLGLIGGVALLGVVLVLCVGSAMYFGGSKTPVPILPPSKPEEDEIKLPELTEYETKVDMAIKKGAAYLEKRLSEGKGPAPGHDPARDSPELRTGGAALLGLALLEVGMRPDSAAIKNALGMVRKEKDSQTSSYALATSLFFLNRLNEASALEESDKQLLRTYALRLIAGQSASGRWGYDCPQLSPMGEAELVKKLNDGSYRPTGQMGHVDNSATQFAMLSLWGVRNSVPARTPLLMAAVQFHSTQLADGSWAYQPEMGSRWNDSNTCAGLLGLAIEKALRNENTLASDPAALPKPTFDKIREDAFNRLGKVIGRKKDDLDNVGQEYQGRLFRAAAVGDIYFLWCVERVAVVYDEKLLGGKDWYQWGSQILLDTQNNDGSWADVYEPAIDTSFAILFLRQANVAKDLTVKTREWRERKRNPATEMALPAKAPPKIKSLFN